MVMNWQKVAEHLKVEAACIRENAIIGFPNDLKVQQEMRTRASLLEAFSRAILAGLED